MKCLYSYNIIYWTVLDVFFKYIFHNAPSLASKTHIFSLLKEFGKSFAVTTFSLWSICALRWTWSESLWRNVLKWSFFLISTFALFWPSSAPNSNLSLSLQPPPPLFLSALRQKGQALTTSSVKQRAVLFLGGFGRHLKSIRYESLSIQLTMAFFLFFSLSAFCSMMKFNTSSLIVLLL